MTGPHPARRRRGLRCDGAVLQTPCATGTARGPTPNAPGRYVRPGRRADGRHVPGLRPRTRHPRPAAADPRQESGRASTSSMPWRRDWDSLPPGPTARARPSGPCSRRAKPDAPPNRPSHHTRGCEAGVSPPIAQQLTTMRAGRRRRSPAPAVASSPPPRRRDASQGAGSGARTQRADIAPPPPIEAPRAPRDAADGNFTMNVQMHLYIGCWRCGQDAVDRRVKLRALRTSGETCRMRRLFRNRGTRTTQPPRRTRRISTPSFLIGRALHQADHCAADALRGSTATLTYP